MGLDMYLKKETYIGAHFTHRGIQGTIDLTYQTPDGGREKFDIDVSRVSEICEVVGTWRKANQIHRWFVNNVQDGFDDQEKHHVSFEQLQSLRDLCIKALETKDPEILPPLKGCFFGNTEINEYYWIDIKETIAIIDRLKYSERAEYYYTSSW